MRTKSLILTLAGICLLGTSCMKDDSVDPSNPNANVPDPEGTVSLSMRNGNGTELPGSSIYIDKADNFVGADFAPLGKVNGLGNVNYIPKTGWTSKVAVTPGEGYVAYKYTYPGPGKFYRIYVSSYTTNILNEVIGAEVKYQTPFYGADEAIIVQKNSITLNEENGMEQVIDFTNRGIIPCSVETEGCQAELINGVEFTSCWYDNNTAPIGIKISMTNNQASDIPGKVTLTTASGKKTEIKVMTKGLETFALSEKALNFGRTESTLTATVMPSDLKITAKSNAEWCSCRIVSNVIEAKLQANTTSKNRSTTVTVNVEGFSDPQTIEIHQNRYAPGDYFNEGGNEGVVFLATGQTGKIIALDETWAQWSTENIETGAKDMDNGMNNQNIIRKLSNWNTKYPAFGWCNSKGEGWYLPAANELEKFMIFYKTLNPTLKAHGGTEILYTSGRWYCSSTEISSESVWFFYSELSSFSKSNTARVRAVRAF